MNLVIYMILVLRNIFLDLCTCFYWFLSQYHKIVVLKRVMFFLPKRSWFVPPSLHMFSKVSKIHFCGASAKNIFDETSYP